MRQTHESVDCLQHCDSAGRDGSAFCRLAVVSWEMTMRCEMFDLNKPGQLSHSEQVVEAVAASQVRTETFPIADPDLAALSELLSKMTVCKEDTPATRMAWEALQKLRAYLLKGK
jgi:hypothetical protein